MTPLQFEQLHEGDWSELESLLAALQKRRRWGSPVEQSAGERVASLYRRCCEQLALARARMYPTYIIDRLESMTANAHQAIYQRREFGVRRFAELIGREIPRTVRARANYVWLSAAVFWIPLIVTGLMVFNRPDLILSVASAEDAAQYEEMYSQAAQSIGRPRTADTDWTMFGFYIKNNISIAFQCFAGGLFAGLGSLFYLAFNGATIGGVAGYLTERGLSDTFYSFAATHSAFELNAIVLSGAAGLLIGHAVIAPGRRTRRQALVAASREAAIILYGAVAMLLVAAGIEAFWSSARWLPSGIKYAVAAAAWLGVVGYLTLQGRNAG